MAVNGGRLGRATLGNWAGLACFHLTAIADHMRKHLAAADRRFMDETTAPGAQSGTTHNQEGFLLGDGVR
ncbi:transposase [Bradyrhizobium sp. CCBAU 51753]|uniref:IS66 family transposase n=1 Tax=Bradyrhizobium sp. CCBAU 51753 TaxID=1325100 RepID=UPI0021115FCB|nr:transposase [Bradyrhizobium sp. CCBAU 51753]